MSTTSTRTRPSRFVDAIGVLAVVTSLVLGLVPGVALATHDSPDPDHELGDPLGAGVFEIDGNIDVDAGHDWADIASYADGGEQTADGLHAADESWFKGGQFESGYPNWQFEPGGNAPKSDLHRLFVASQVAEAGSYLWLGASRLADNGSTQVTVEFNQADGDTLDLASGYRVSGDFYITWNFPGKPKPGDPTDGVLVKIGSWPDGRSAGSYPTEVSLSSSDFRYAIGSIVPGAFDFIELELDLTVIFDPEGEGGLGLTCGQFGAVSFRTESSGGGGGGTDASTLKDVAGPFAINLDTCVDVDVNKVDADNNPLNGASFAAFGGLGAAADGTAAATCITGPDATDIDGANTEEDGWCSLGAMLPGDYTLHEVAWDEDAEAWVSGAPEGYETSQDLPDDFTVGDVSLDLGAYTDPRIDYAIDVAPDGRNAVGEPHTFTVTLKDDTDTGLAGEDIALTWSGAAAEVTSVTPAGPDADSLDCTTNASGQCTVVVSRTAKGTESLTASWTTPYQNASGDGGPSTDTEAVASISDSATKTWVGYEATIDPTRTNLLGDEHPFTVTVYEVDGTVDNGEEDRGPGVDGTLVNGVTVTVTWSDDAPTNSTIDGNASTTTCVTGEDDNDDGECVVTVDSDDAAGKGIASVTRLVGDIDNLGALADDELTVNFAEGAVSADKTWREYRALIDGNATNPVGEAHTFHVQVQYRDDDNAASWTDAQIEDMTVAWSNSGSAGSVDDAASTCNKGTDADGHCTIVVDTDVDDPGSRKVELTSVTGDLLPDDVPSNTNLTYTFDDTQYDEAENEFREATKTWIEFGANIIRDGKNLVSPDDESTLGEHTFTVTVWRKPAPGSDATAVPAETKVTTSIGWVSDFPQPPDLVRDNNCLDDGTSNVPFDGSLYSQCTITLNSTVPGVATVTPTGLVGYDYGDGNGSQGVTFADVNTESAVKTWYRYRAWIDADSTNLAGDPEGDHDFKVTVEQDSGGGWGPVPNDTTVTVTSPDDATNDGTLKNSSCETTTTEDVSSCKIAVSSLLPGSRKVTVDTVEALAVDNTPPVDVSNGEYLDVEDPTQRTAATKTWVSYSATISADATNLTGQDHVFTVKAFVDSGDGPVPAPAGTTLTIDVDSDYLSTDVADPNTCDDGTGEQTNPITEQPAAGNECFVTVSSDSVSAVTVQVTGVTPDEGVVDDDPTDPVSGVQATKTWIDVLVGIDPDSPTNIAGDAHTFTVDLTINGPNDTTIDHTGASVGFEVDGADVVYDDELVGVTGSTCDDALVAGQDSCTIVVHSDTAGTADIAVTSVEFSYDGKDFGPIDFTDTESSVGKADGQDLGATKTWLQYRTTIVNDGLNRVGDAHMFTVTVEQTDMADPTPGDWSDVEGAVPTLSRKSGIGDVVAGDGTCDTGTDASGECTVWVDSEVSGTGVFHVSKLVVDDPATEAVDEHTLGDGGATDVAFDNSDTASKTWAAFRASISVDSQNTTGDAHQFVVDADYTTAINPAPGDWLPVPEGSTITVSANGTGGIVDDDDVTDTTCATAADAGPGTDAAGSCSVWVDSEVSGSLEVTVDSVTASIPDGDGTKQFTVTFGRDAEDDPNPGLLADFDSAGAARTSDGDDYASTKTWATYQLLLSPETAVNLLNSSLEEDPEESHTITARLTSDDPADDGLAPIVGQTVNFTVSGAGVTFDGGGTTATCVTVADDPDTEDVNEAGTCTVAITSDSPAHATVNATYSAKVGDSTTFTTIHGDANSQEEGIQPATKTWTTFFLTVTPENAVNLVETPHVFTVTLWESDLTADCGDAAVDGFCRVETTDAIGIDVPGDALTVTTDCDKGTDPSGQCTVAVTSSTVQAVTLTATYREPYADYDSATASIAAVFSDFSDSGDKSWIDYDIAVVGDDENLVDTVHTFTVQLSTIVPDGEGGTTRIGIEGAHPEIHPNGRGTIQTNTCAPGQQGTVVAAATPEVGTCTVKITSAVAGVTTIDASYLGFARILDDGIDDQPGDESRTYDTRTSEEDDTGDKLWVDYRLTLGEDAVNAVGDPHTFTATLTRSEDGNADEDFLPAPGEALTFTFDGVGSVIDGDLSCTTDGKGQCDIVINSDEGGTSTVGVSHLAVVGPTSETFRATAIKKWVDIELVKTAVVGDGFGDGDLVADPDTGLPTLFFTSSDRGPKTAVFEYTITNTGPETLFGLTLVDDRLGGIALAEGLTLEPGTPTTVRASEQFDYDDAAGGLSNIITNVGVVTAQSADGTEVSDTDDAVIQLIAQQSSILIDLQKDVVVGAGDVEALDGPPTVTWSQSELEAGASKVVRYAFTVTNIGPSPIVDVELTDPMISSQPLIAVADGVTLQPGESTVVEIDHVLTADEAFPDGPTAREVPNVAAVSGANETRDSFDQDSDDAIVFVQVVFAEREARVLPATGLGSGGLLPVSMLLITVGAAVLWLNRRRVTGR